MVVVVGYAGGGGGVCMLALGSNTTNAGFVVSNVAAVGNTAFGAYRFRVPATLRACCGVLGVNWRLCSHCCVVVITWLYMSFVKAGFTCAGDGGGVAMLLGARNVSSSAMSLSTVALSLLNVHATGNTAGSA
jgi:hypothetical protein